jgi:hypothetical protein
LRSARASVSARAASAAALAEASSADLRILRGFRGGAVAG